VRVHILEAISFGIFALDLALDLSLEAQETWSKHGE
jgi:hypothetical protein